MVQISGSSVRTLREQQNLTQLYLATAVGVTTETISRWERQESPTIKEENGLKLADVLSVSLQELRDVEEQGSEGPADLPPQSGPLRPARIVALFLVVALVLFSVLLFIYVGRKSVAVIQLTGRRNMPAHSVSGQPFPVVLEVAFAADKKSSFLLIEQIPSGCRVLKTVPPATVMEDGLLKWIDKDGPGHSTFAYIASCTPVDFATPLAFNGSLLVRQARRKEVVVEGSKSLRLLPFHWADSDKNGVIDDEELLAVYDDFGRVAGLGVDVEEVEAIWMGSGYRWDSSQQVFTILP